MSRTRVPLVGGRARVRALVYALLLASVLARPAARAGVVISEIHYHPREASEALEFVELTNDSATPVDISGWVFSEGIFFEIPHPTVLAGYGSVVICRDVDAVTARYGIANALGNFVGRLDNDGDRLTLHNHGGAVVASFRYDDDGKWPGGPDGTGHTLALRSVYLDPSEPESWTQSRELGGTPGELNFPGSAPEVNETVIVGAGEDWRYRRGTAAFSVPADAWTTSGFADAAWEVGPSGFGFGDDDDATVLDDMQDGYTSVAIRKRFNLSAGDLAAAGDYYLGVDFDDGFCAYLNGAEIGRANCGTAGVVPAWNDTATQSREAGSEVLFAVPRGLLAEGVNVLALAGFNLSIGSSDFSLTPRLLRREVVDSGPVVVDEVFAPADATWRFRRGVAPFSSPASAWLSPGFDDGAWESGSAGFGFRRLGDGAVAYVVAAGTFGNQDFSGPLGMDFDVEREITVTRLGVFDSGADGLSRPLTATLYNRDTSQSLGELSFSAASPGEALGGSRFKDLPSPVTLPAGFHGTMVAEGYGAGEPNGNQGSQPLAGLSTDDGAGAIRFVGGGRFGNPGAFPSEIDGGPENRYAAGTFEFTNGAPGGDGEVVAPAGVRTVLTDMPGGYTSLAARYSFTLSASQANAPGDWLLAIDFDDGLCAFVGGVEVARVNCPAGTPRFDAVATGARAVEGEQLFAVPAGLVVAGENVVAIAAYSTGFDDTDFELSPRLFRRRVIDTGGSAGGVVFNELLRGAAPGAGWIELYNPSAASVDLVGFSLAQQGGLATPYELPAGATIPPRGFLVVSEAEGSFDFALADVQLFLLSGDGIVVAATTFRRAPDLADGAWSECRFPDGGPLDWVTATPTRGASNSVARTESIVINEIFYHPPGEDRPGEFIELFNRGGSTVDLSGFRFDDGIELELPPGTSLLPGGYLVVAEDPAYIATYYGVTALGPYTGSLANRGERVRLVDRLGNPADSVRYHDGGRWALAADGGGSSLELIDPAQDNDVAAAWSASDESAKADWEEYRFLVDSYVPASESELNLYLVERGVCLVDDISIRRDGGANHVANPGFESSTTGWLIGGTHVESDRTTLDSRSGSASLRVVATGKGDTLVNRIETETSPRLTAGPYEVSLWARWIEGSDLLVVHGEYHPGPYRITPCITCGVAAPSWSGNSMAAALRLTVPFDLGTPGAENSATRRLRGETGAVDLGPVIAEVEHQPALPEPNTPVTVTARVSDAGGVASVEVLYRADSPAGVFERLVMFDDGMHGDGGAGDGRYGAQLPASGTTTRIVFYIEARDAGGRAGVFPADAPERTCLYIVQPFPQARTDAYFVALDARQTAELQTRPLHSNALVDGTFVFENEKAYYNIGVRYRGSPWGRPSRSSYRVRFPKDDRFHGGLRDFNLNRSGTSTREAGGHFVIGRNAQQGRPSPATDYLFAEAWLNGSGLGMKGVVETVDGAFIEKWHGEGADGPLLKANGRFVFTDSGGLTGQQGWEGASLIYRGEDPENYRGYFFHSTEQSRDDWEELIALTRLLDRTMTPDAAFAEEVDELIDLQAFFRVLSARIILGDGDAFAVNNGHNGYIAHNSLSGLWQLVAFDLEAAGGSFDLFASLDPGITRLLTHPKTRRAYMGVLAEFADGYLSAARSGPWLSALEQATGLSAASTRSLISSGQSRIRSALNAPLAVPFRIITQGGEDFETDEPSVTLEGDAPVDIVSLILLESGDSTRLDPAWSTPTRWRVTIDLPRAVNELTFLGIDGSGNIAASADITITTDSPPAGFMVSGWFPDSGPLAGGTEVTFFGGGFVAGMAVSFGGVPATGVRADSATVLVATTPPGSTPGAVPIEVRSGPSRLTLANAFRYTLAGSFVRGDVNADRALDIGDALRLLFFLAPDGEATVPCAKSADANDDGRVDLGDVLRITNFLFLAGAAPPAPFPSCGLDPSADGLGCEGFTPCE